MVELTEGGRAPIKRTLEAHKQKGKWQCEQ